MGTMPALSLSSAVRAVVDELRRARDEGERDLVVTDEALAALESRLRAGSTAHRPAPDLSGNVPPESPAKPTAEAPAKSPPKTVVEIPSPVAEAPRERRRAASRSAPPPADLPDPPHFELPAGSPREQWEWLREKVLSCPVCREHLNPGKKLVFGRGSVESDLFFCGEAPGAEEEDRGLPFVGPAGELLDKMIGAMGLEVDSVYIGNVMNWRPRTSTPFGNRPPTPEEMRFCMPYLKAQLAIVRPKVVVALGGTAASALFDIDTKGRMGRLRGQWKETAEGIPAIITYHPSFLLHNGTTARKRQVWEDLLAVMERLELPISEKQRNYFL